jgi:two-component system response regulator YesN
MSPRMLRFRSPYLVFARFLASYVLVLIIPLFFSSLSYFQTASSLQRESRDEEFRLLQQQAGLLDQRFSEVEGLIAQIMSDRRIAGLLDIESPYQNGKVIPGLLDYRASLAPFRSRSSLVAVFQVYLQKSGVVITPETIYISLPAFYGSFLRYGGHDTSWWLNLIFGSYHRNRILPAEVVSFDPKGAGERMVAVVQSLPLEAYSHLHGALVVFMRDSELQKFLTTLSMTGGSAYILDSEGQVITSTRPEIDAATFELLTAARSSGTRETSLRGARVIVSSIASSSQGLFYVTVSPANHVQDRFAYVLRTAWVILLAAGLVGFAAAFLVANRNRKPLASLMAMLGRVTPAVESGQSELLGGTYLEYVQQGVRRLLMEEERLQRTVEERMPLMRSVFVQQLLAGEYVKLEDAQTHMAQLGLEPMTGSVMAMAVRICFTGVSAAESIVPRLNVAKAALRQLLGSVHGYRGFLHEPSFDEIAVLLAWRDDQEQRAVSSIQHFATQAQEILFVGGEGTLLVGVGAPAANVLSAKQSYEGALSALAYRGRRSDQGPLWMHEIPAHSEAAYPVSKEANLTKYARAGDLAGSESVLAQIFAGPLAGKLLSVSGLRELDVGIRGTMQRLLEQLDASGDDSIGLQASMDAYSVSSTIDGMYEGARSFFSHFCGLANGRKRSHNLKLRDAVVTYVNEHYSDFQLYLPTVAERFGISKEYLSRFFKEQMGENFSVYLERLRIDRAADLLAHTDTAIHEVARQCGYSGIFAFRKAFKRVAGTAPSDYRAQHRFH